MRIRRILVGSVAVLGVACGGNAPPAPVSQPVAPPPARDAPVTGDPASAAPPAPVELYPIAEAIADAAAGPLEFVGMGPWPGTFRRFSCAYKNDRVIVIEHHCLPNTASDIRVQILSPTRGSVGVTAQAKKGAIAGQRRPQYRDMFGGSSAGGAGVRLDMSYEEIVALQEDERARPAGTCVYRLDSGAKCYEAFEGKTEAFAERAEPFFSEPPEAWYQLIAQLAELDARPKRPTVARTAENLREIAAVFARALGMDLTDQALERMGRDKALFSAAVVLDDGHMVVAGSRPMKRGDRGYRKGAKVAALVRLDEHGAPVWTANLRPGRYDQHDHPFVVRTPDGGFALLAWVSRKGGLQAATKLAKLDGSGKVQWEWTGKLRYYAQSARVTPEGGFLFEGHFNPPGGRDARGWKGEISPRGKLVSEEVTGEPLYGD